MKVATIIIRVLLGSLLLFTSISYFLTFDKQPELTGDLKTVFEGFKATKYLLTLVKIVEFLSGLSFLTGKFIKLFSLVFFPVSINILLINVFLIQSGFSIAIAIFVFLSNIFLIYRSWESYKGIFAS
ncbi:MAG TPA: hypothetical protein VLB74_07615 [Flavobacterium sp.]|uniref:DoxX family protein n=1 Tax=Flavobacterium sp. TaxID=239 RepID=UPI002C7CCE10|nr:DoxX family protein [Flavobacterium sp.]HSD14499.1 hypothetical protein [Flavobacterium sp.]